MSPLVFSSAGRGRRPLPCRLKNDEHKILHQKQHESDDHRPEGRRKQETDASFPLPLVVSRRQVSTTTLTHTLVLRCYIHISHPNLSKKQGTWYGYVSNA